MKTQHIEMARQAVALLRDVLTGEDPARFVSTNSALGKSTHSLAICLWTHPASVHPNNQSPSPAL